MRYIHRHEACVTHRADCSDGKCTFKPDNWCNDHDASDNCDARAPIARIWLYSHAEKCGVSPGIIYGPILGGLLTNAMWLLLIKLSIFREHISS